MKKFASRLATVVVAVGLTVGLSATSAAPVQAMVDTSWGRIVVDVPQSITD